MAREYGKLTFDESGGSKTFSISVVKPLTIDKVSAEGGEWISVNGNNGSFTATCSSSDSERDDVITITIDKETCGKIDCHQKGKVIECGCDDFSIDTESYAWPPGQTNPIRRYYEAGECIEIYEMYESPEHLEDKGHYTARTTSDSEGTYVEIWPTIANTRPSPYKSTWYVRYRKDGTIVCDQKGINLMHEGIGCSCEYLTISVDNIREWQSTEYGSSNAQIIKYNIAEGKEDCIKVDTIQVKKSGANSDKFDIDSRDINNVKVYPIAENPDEDNDYKVTISYEYELSDGSSCTGEHSPSIEFTQMKAACSCTKLLESPCILTTVPLGSGTYQIGTGQTRQCGVFTGTSTASFISNVTVNTSQDVSTFYVTVNGTSENSGDLKIYFKYYDENIDDESCSTTKNIIQTADYVSCERFESISIDDKTIPYREHGEEWSIASLSSTAKQSIKAFDKWGLLKFETETGGDWLSSFRVDANGDIKAQVSDSTGEARETNVIMSLNDSASSYGICNCTNTVVWKVKQDPLSCFCTPQETGETTYTYSYFSNQDNSSIVKRDARCYRSTGAKFAIEDRNGNITSPSEYTELPGEDSWVRVRIDENSSSDGLGATIRWEYTENPRRSQRTAYFYQIAYLANDIMCRKKLILNQNGKAELTCEEIFNPVSIKKGIIDSLGATNEQIAHYDTNSEYAIENGKLSGEIMNGVTWVTLSNPSSSNALYANVQPNIEQLSQDNDGYTSERECSIRVFVVDSNGNPAKDKDGNPCTGETHTFKQSGFSGYCPVCSSMHNTNIGVNYNGYGEMQCIWDPAATTPLYVPGFHGDDSSVLTFFECDLNGIITTKDSVNIRCFGLTASTSHQDILSGSLVAERVSGSLTKYKIKGKLRHNTSASSIPISIELRLTKRNFSDNTEIPCENTLEQGHIILLIDGKDCNGN